VPNVFFNLEPGMHSISSRREAFYLSNFFARTCTPATADVQLASLTDQVKAHKRSKNKTAFRKRSRRNDDDVEVDDEEEEEDDEEDDDEDDNDDEVSEALRQSLASRTPAAEEQIARVRQFVEMGFEEEKVRNILAACEWDSEAALTTLLSS
jgi:hypothetical protein